MWLIILDNKKRKAAQLTLGLLLPAKKKLKKMTRFVFSQAFLISGQFRIEMLIIVRQHR